MSGEETPGNSLDGNDESGEESAPRTTAGELLRGAREKQHLSVQQVAEKMYLTRHYIEALEANSYDKLPGDVFVRGYLRSYARLLGLDSADILSRYERYGERRQARKQEAIKRHARRRMDKNRPWIMVSGFAFIALAVAMWFFSGQPEQPGPVPDATPSSLMAEGGDNDSVIADSPATSATPSEPGVQAGGVTAEPENAQDRVASMSESQSAAEDEQLIDWGGSDSLIVSIHGESRVEIEDRNGGNSYQDLLVDGTVLRILGTAPFTVILGDATVVELNFNGRSIDISANVRSDDSARLTLGL